MSKVELDEVKFINFFTYRLFSIANKTVKVFIQNTICWNLLSWIQFSIWCASSLTDKYEFFKSNVDWAAFRLNYFFAIELFITIYCIWDDLRFQTESGFIYFARPFILSNYYYDMIICTFDKGSVSTTQTYFLNFCLK